MKIVARGGAGKIKPANIDVTYYISNSWAIKFYTCRRFFKTFFFFSCNSNKSYVWILAPLLINQYYGLQIGAICNLRA